MRPADKRELVTYTHVEHGLSLRRACQAFSLSRSVYGYQPKESDDELVIEALVRLAEKHPRFGFGKLFPLLRREQPMWNHKRVLRKRSIRRFLRRLSFLSWFIPQEDDHGSIRNRGAFREGDILD